MSKFQITVTQKVIYCHTILVEGEEEDLDDAMDRLSRIEPTAYGDFTEFIPEIEGCGEVTVTDTIEDESGLWEWDFDYNEV